MNSQKYTTTTFPVFNYSAHVSLCGDTVVLSGVKLFAGIHECLSEFFYGTWSGAFDRTWSGAFDYI